jgi:1,4-dihydroxy-2-naphthoyl-CoA hydrolase
MPSAWAHGGAALPATRGGGGPARSRAARCRRGTRPLSWGAVAETVDMEVMRARGRGRFPGDLGVEVLEVAHGLSRMRLAIEERHLAPNGLLHAGVVVGLADTACGYGCVASLPDGAANFATIELKTNFLATALDGVLECEARLVHGGRTTQVWDAHVRADGKTLALFRCTQLVLYPS